MKIQIRPRKSKSILAISFSNYLTSVGGMSKYMMANEKMYSDAGYSYISIYFVKKIVKKKYHIFHFYGLIIDGEEVGIFTLDDVIQYFRDLEKEGYAVKDAHIHNISYMNAKHIIRLSDSMPITPFKLILHDFHTICSNFNLLKNGETYCGGHAPSEEKCFDCRFYKPNFNYIRDVRQVIEHLKPRLTVIAPSEVAGQIWLEAYPDFKDRVVTVTEQLWRGEYKENLESVDPTKHLVIGYLGNRSPHKGWNQWSEFVARANDKHNQYECIVFNSKKDFEDRNMSHCPVRFKQGNLNAMVDALRNERIDCAILWSIWPETYSYTLFEAISANAFILTNPNSGNIAYTVRKRGNGLVLGSEEKLYYYAENPDKLIEKINDYRNSSEPGPELLVDNTELVTYTNPNQKFTMSHKKSNAIYRYEQKLLLAILLKASKAFKIRL